MKLTMNCEAYVVKPKDGAISTNEFNQVLSNSGVNTLVILSNSQALPVSELSPVISAAGAKNLLLKIDCTRASQNQAVQIINSSTGQNTSLELGSLTSFTAQGVTAVIQALGNKKCTVEVNGTSSSQTQAVHLINSVTSANTSIRVSSLGAMPGSAVSAVVQALGNRAFTASIDAAVTSISSIVNVFNVTANSNAALSLDNADAIGANGILQAIQAIGNRKLSIGLNAGGVTPSNLQSIIAGAGGNIGFSVANIQNYGVNEMAAIINFAGAKALSVSLDGLSSLPIQIQQAVSAGKPTTTVSVNAANNQQLGVMLDAVNASGNTNFNAIYNSAQLVVTPTDGNYVVRVLQVAKPSTSVVLAPVGVGTFRWDLLLDIMNAAG